MVNDLARNLPQPVASRGTGVSLSHAASSPANTVIDVSGYLPAGAASSLLALGGELKNTICLVQNRRAALSRDHGDLIDSDSFCAFLDDIKQFSSLLIDSDSHQLVCDMHPGYSSTRFAMREDACAAQVQHHYAHGVSCAVDAGLTLPVIAIVCDGTGYGTDGAIWGGEVLLCGANAFSRLGHLDYFRLPGGDAAARSTWRPALAMLQDMKQKGATGVSAKRSASLPVSVLMDDMLSGVSQNERRLVGRQLDTGFHAPQSSSMGRLFDAVAALLGVCLVNEYEGQAAVALQAAADKAMQQHAGGLAPYAYELHASENQPTRLDWRPLVAGLVADRAAGVGMNICAARFHLTVIDMLSAAALRAAEQYHVDRIVLSGGCFHNRLLREGVCSELRGAGVTVGTHEQVSCGDAGLSLGQAIVGAWRKDQS